MNENANNAGETSAPHEATSASERKSEPKTASASEPDTTVAGNTIERLLKTPRTVALNILREDKLAAESAKMLLIAALCYAAFGFAVGLFGGLEIAATAAWKAPLITLCSMLLCFPSLFVFTAVQGSPMTPGRAFALGCACLAMTGLIVVGLAPVAWLFANSTESLPFVMVMTLFIWVVSLPFASRFLRHAQEAGLLRQVIGLKLWLIVFIAVTLQMTTVMRPILTAPEQADSPSHPRKIFFMEHFFESFDR